jgi:hypothetical protein
MGPVSVLISISFVADGLIDFHAVPVRVQLIRHNQRKCRADRGAHLRAVRNDVHRPVCFYSHEHIRMKGRPVSLSLSVRRRVTRKNRRHVSNGQHKRSRGHNSLQKPAAAHVFNVSHALFSAASLIAARIRW